MSTKLNVTYKATPAGEVNILINADRPNTNLLVSGLAGSEVANLEVLKVEGQGVGEEDTDASFDSVYVDGAAFQFTATENMQTLAGVGVYRVNLPAATAGEVVIGTYRPSSA